jgi:hypothetical protein
MERVTGAQDVTDMVVRRRYLIEMADFPSLGRCHLVPVFVDLIQELRCPLILMLTLANQE